MTRSDIAAQIDSIWSVDDLSQLRLLESLYASLSPTMITAEIYCAILRLFERFPGDDAYEGFWSYLHLLEKCRQFESLLVDSVRRQPAVLTISMMNRLLNGGYTHVGSQDLRALLNEAMINPNTSSENRRIVRECIERHGVSSSDAA